MRLLFLGLLMLSLVSSCLQNGRDGFAMPEIGETNKTNRLNASLIALSEVLDANTEAAEVYFRRAKVNFELNQMAEALVDINASTRIETNIAEYLFLKSQILLALDEPVEALNEAQNASDAGIDTPLFYTYLAGLYVSMDSLALANDYLSEALLMAPKWIRALQLKGQILTKMKEPNEALLVLDNALALDTENPDTYDLLAKAYLEIGRLDSAIRLTERGFEFSDNEHFGLWYNRGKIMEKLGRGDSAIRVYSKVLTFAPKETLVNVDIAEIHLGRGNFTRANRFFQRAIDVSPNKKSVYIRAGYCLERLFKYDEALELYLKARNKFPNEERFSQDFDRMTDKVERQYRSTKQ